ncbi:MAG: 30S ribosomal protein S15 [Nitrospinae bacterium]|nr:30S ribosomal protein S15 [Nitrospinota bacterium]
MALAKQVKTEIIGKFKKSEADTGSSEVQIALLSGRIQSLSKHFETHAKDNHSKRSLLMMVNQRRRLLDYLKGTDFNRYKTTIEALGIRK